MSYLEHLKNQKEYSQKGKEELEKQLEKIGFTQHKLQESDSDQLFEKLEEMNNVLTNPSAFGLTDLTYAYNHFNSAEGKNESFQYVFEIKPYLEERKNYLIDLLREKATHGSLSKLEQLGASIQDSSLRDNIEGVIKDSFKSLKKLEDQKKPGVTTDDRIKILEKKSQFIKSLLEKETTANLVGSIMILVFTIVIVICLFNDIKIENTLLGNAFLILLGYFFGQQSIRTSKA